jgi:hypothetical protein
VGDRVAEQAWLHLQTHSLTAQFSQPNARYGVEYPDEVYIHRLADPKHAPVRRGEILGLLLEEMPKMPGLQTLWFGFVNFVGAIVGSAARSDACDTEGEQQTSSSQRQLCLISGRQQPDLAGFQTLRSWRRQPSGGSDVPSGSYQRENERCMHLVLGNLVSLLKAVNLPTHPRTP